MSPRLLAVAVLVGATLTCRESVAPSAERLNAADQTTIRDLLTNPLVDVALTGISDQPTADQLRGGIADLTRMTTTASPHQFEAALQKLRNSPVFTTAESQGSDDRPELDLVALTLDQTDWIVTASRDSALAQ